MRNKIRSRGRATSKTRVVLETLVTATAEELSARRRVSWEHKQRTKLTGVASIRVRSTPLRTTYIASEGNSRTRRVPAMRRQGIEDGANGFESGRIVHLLSCLELFFQMFLRNDMAPGASHFHWPAKFRTRRRDYPAMTAQQLTAGLGVRVPRQLEPIWSGRRTAPPIHAVSHPLSWPSLNFELRLRVVLPATSASATHVGAKSTRGAFVYVRSLGGRAGPLKSRGATAGRPLLCVRFGLVSLSERARLVRELPLQGALWDGGIFECPFPHLACWRLFDTSR